MTLNPNTSENLGNYNGLTLVSSRGGSFVGAVLMISGYGVKPTVISDTTSGRVGPEGTHLKFDTADGTTWGTLRITNVSDQSINFSLMRVNLKGV